MKHEAARSLVVFMLMVLAGGIVFCKSKSTELKPVQSFNAQRYMGKWYEIARFDFKFEKDMSKVTADYSLNDNGTIKVVNSGYDDAKGKWKEKIGKAKFAGANDEGALKVSFFGPFYSAYTIIALDEDYSYALVAGANNKLMWILSRTPGMPDYLKEKYLKIAQDAGYDTTELVWTEQN